MQYFIMLSQEILLNLNLNQEVYTMYKYNRSLEVTCVLFKYSYIFWSLFVCLMVFKATFNNISVISWQSVLLVEETRVPGENHRPVASHWQTLSHNVISSTPHLSRVRTHNNSGGRHWLHNKFNFHLPTSVRLWRSPVTSSNMFSSSEDYTWCQSCLQSVPKTFWQTSPNSI